MEIHETIGNDRRVLSGRGVDIRTIADLRSGAETLAKDFHFDGVNVFRCYEGRYRIERKGYPVVCLEPGEMFVTYPGHWVTIKALKKPSRLIYGVFTGNAVTDFFNDLGCFDGMRGQTLPREECVVKLCGLMKPEAYQTAAGHDSCMSYLADLVGSMVGDVRENGNALVFDAIRQIRRNLSKGVVRIQDLCNELGVCRSYLHRVFRSAGLGSVAEFIKAEQLHGALAMLRDTDWPISEIARKSGFISVTHFSTFIKKRVGRTPHELRR